MIQLVIIEIPNVCQCEKTRLFKNVLRFVGFGGKLILDSEVPSRSKKSFELVCIGSKSNVETTQINQND